MHALSIYSGILGLDFAAEAAGMHTVAYCEPDPWCRRYIAHYRPGVPCYEYDTDITAAGLARDGIPAVDILIGGPPCQPSSAAGKRLGASDPRWRWPEFLRIAGEVRPRWIVAENPRGLLTVAAGRAFAGILAELGRLGYRTGRCLIGADEVGAPHRRDRVFIIGCLAHATSRLYTDESPIACAQPAMERPRFGAGGRVGRWAVTAGVPQRGGTDASGASNIRRCDVALGEGHGWQHGRPQPAREQGGFDVAECGPGVGLADSWGTGLQGLPGADGARGQAWAGVAGSAGSPMEHTTSAGEAGTTLLPLGIAADGAAPELARHPGGGFPGADGQPGHAQYDFEPARTATGERERVAKLKALGNAVVWLQALPVFQAIMASDTAIRQ